MHLQTVGRWVVLGLLVWCAMIAAAAASDERQACGPQPRLQDQVWLVSHRGLGCHVAQHAEGLRYWRYDCETGWVRSSFEELRDRDDGNLTTTVFVHGNRISSCQAFQTGWKAYRALVRCAGPRPVRFIVWSWPSGQIRGPLNDARVKAARTNASAFYLASFADRLDSQAPLGMWGHSFGARIVTGALQLLAGGRLCGFPSLQPTGEKPQPVRAVLVAAALDNNWLARGHAHAMAMSQVEGLLLLNNSCDAVLKRYHRIYHRRACAQALGFTGLSSCWVDGAAWKKIRQVDACCQVGKQHAFAGYLCSSRLMALVRDQLLPEIATTASEPRDDTIAGPLLTVEP